MLRGNTLLIAFGSYKAYLPLSKPLVFHPIEPTKVGSTL
jgi:hypothetical protein